MPDEPLTPDLTDQTDLNAAPESGEHTDTGGDSYEERYKNLQAEFTRKTQELSGLKSEHEQYQQWYQSLTNPETQAQALNMLGLELENEQQDPFAEQPDPTEALRAEISELKQWREQQSEQAQLQQLESEINAGIKGHAEQAGLDLDPKLQKLLFNNVIASPPRADGTPDIEGVFEEFTGLKDQLIKNYRETKRRAPSPPVPGSPGNPDHKFGDAKSRLQLANMIAEEAIQQHAG
jgi:Skp family chaperone for outer membrane proteins